MRTGAVPTIVTGIQMYNTALYIADIYSGYTGMNVTDPSLFGGDIDLVSNGSNIIWENHRVHFTNHTGPFTLILNATEPVVYTLTGDFNPPMPPATGTMTGTLVTGISLNFVSGRALLISNYTTGGKQSHYYGINLYQDFEPPSITLNFPI